MHPEDTLRLYKSSLHTHDFSPIRQLISPTALFWFNDGSFSGLEQIQRAFEETWRKFPFESYWLEDLVWLAHADDCAACTYHFRWRAKIDEKPLEGGGRGTTILRKEEDSWKIVHEHLSQFPEQE